jgi:hypothetical protein
VATLIDWAWAYFTYQRHARLILGGASDGAVRDAAPRPAVRDEAMSERADRSSRDLHHDST